MGFFTGKRPTDVGLAVGRLRAGDWKPNWVSSQVPATDAKHFIEPLRFSGSPESAWKALDKAVRAIPGGTFVTQDPGYIHIEFASAVFGFVDDAEFKRDSAAGLIHVRSGARLGIRDFDVNRKRIEAIRAALR